MSSNKPHITNSNDGSSNVLTINDKKHKRRKLLLCCSSIQVPIGLILWLFGTAWLVSLPFFPMKRTYFSENALSVGQGELSFPLNNEIQLDILTQELTSAYKSSGESGVNSFVEQQLKKWGVEAYTQPFRLSGLNSTAGTNIIGIARAQKGDGKESMVISVPYKKISGWAPKLSLGLLLFNHMANQAYLSKDLIFIAVDNDLYGAKAFVDEYYTPSSGAVSPFKRGGIIYSAINVDCARSQMNSIEVLIEGINGLLPNLDLVNLAIKYGETQGFDVQLSKSIVSGVNIYSDDIYTSWAKNLIGMIARQSTGIPTSIHGMFLPYRVESLTLKCSKSGSSMGYSRGSFARVAEATLRSINALSEKFHQSFFFYLLPHTKAYLSIAVYLPPLGVMISGLFISSLLIWWRSQQTDASSVKLVSPPQNDSVSLSYRGFHLVALSLLCCFICGGALFYRTPKIAESFFELSKATPLNSLLAELSYKECLLVAFSTLMVLTIVFSIVILSKLSTYHSTSFQSQTKSYQSYTLVPLKSSVKSAALILYCAIFIALGTLNFSLAICMVFFLIPVTIIGVFPSPSSSSSSSSSSTSYLLLLVKLLWKLIQYSLLILTNPVTILIFYHLLMSYTTQISKNPHDFGAVGYLGPFASPKLWKYAIDNSSQTLYSFIEHWELLNVWTFPIICFVYWPLQLVLWSTIC